MNTQEPNRLFATDERARHSSIPESDTKKSPKKFFPSRPIFNDIAKTAVLRRSGAGTRAVNSGGDSPLGDLHNLKLPLSGSREHLRWYKPHVFRDIDASGRDWVFKKYPTVGFPVSCFFHFLANHEYQMLKQAEGLAFAPRNISRGSSGVNEISYQYIEGNTIKYSSENNMVPVGFFPKLYSAVLALHHQGQVHLDLGNSGNVLVSKSGDPVIVDFGAAFSLARKPAFLKRWMRKSDLLGVLKLWHRFDNKTMPAFLLEYYQRNYRKNVYTPRRFYKALKRTWSGHRNRVTEDELANAEVFSVIGLCLGLMVLVTFW